MCVFSQTKKNIYTMSMTITCLEYYCSIGVTCKYVKVHFLVIKVLLDALIILLKLKYSLNSFLKTVYTLIDIVLCSDI